jgi:hypothetical protein
MIGTVGLGVGLLFVYFAMVRGRREIGGNTGKR